MKRLINFFKRNKKQENYKFSFKPARHPITGRWLLDAETKELLPADAPRKKIEEAIKRQNGFYLDMEKYLIELTGMQITCESGDAYCKCTEHAKLRHPSNRRYKKP